MPERGMREKKKKKGMGCGWDGEKKKEGWMRGGARQMKDNQKSTHAPADGPVVVHLDVVGLGPALRELGGKREKGMMVVCEARERGRG